MSCFSDHHQTFAKRKGIERRHSIWRQECASEAQDALGIQKVPKNVKLEFRKHVQSQVPILPLQEQTRLKNSAKVLTVDERLDALVKREEMTKQQNEQAERARSYFHYNDERRSRETKANAAKDGNEDVFEKQKALDLAFLAKQEQEDEVKAANRFILHAKCQAIRDSQMKEKRDIERNTRDEQIRLERITIEENAKALAKEDFLSVNQKGRSEKYAREIREQLLQRENMRFIEAERTEEEAKAQRAANAVLQEEEELRQRQGKERGRKFREELDRIVEMSNLFKKMLREQEIETDARIEAYMREKRDREKSLEREKQLARQELERKQQLLYELAKKRMVSKSQREEIDYIKEQEHAEREFRIREREAALRRKRLENDINESRQRQSQEIKTRQALQMARDEKDFMLMIQNLKNEEEALRKQEELRKRQNDSYLAEIKRQISDKAVSRRRMMEFERNEGKIWRDVEKKRLNDVKIAINAKLTAMREACLPEHYIKDIERQMDRIFKRSPHK